MLDKPYIAKEGSCFYCEQLTNQYYDEDGKWICDKCLFELEEELEQERETYIYLSNSEPKGSTPQGEICPVCRERRIIRQIPIPYYMKCDGCDGYGQLSHNRSSDIKTKVK